MASSSTLIIQIIADAGKAKKVLAETSDDVTLLGKATDGMGKLMAAGVAAGVAGIVALGAGAYEAAAESARIGRETERVIRTTGAAAWTSAGQVSELAGAISDKTGADDEAIQSGENLLLTFTRVRNEAGAGNDVFDQATQAALDMSTALGSDMSSASIQLGKALNDPIKGIAALSRAGVSFTEQQKEQIKLMVESGDLLGAQKVILGEVSKEFGGAAEAAATPLDKLKVAIGNLQEDIGAKLIPAVDTAASFLVNNMGPALEAATGFVADHGEAIKFLASVGLAGLAAAYVPVIAGQAALIAGGAVDWAIKLGGQVSILTGIFLDTAAAEGVLAGVTKTLSATMIPVAAALVLVGGAVYALTSLFDKASEPAEKFYAAVQEDVDTSSLKSLEQGTQRVYERMQDLNKTIQERTFGDAVAGAADLLIPFHDVENSIVDVNKEFDNLYEKEMAQLDAINRTKAGFDEYATSSVLAAHGLDDLAAACDQPISQTIAMNNEITATREKLEAIAEAKKIDLTTPDAVDRVTAMYQATTFATTSTLQMSEAQEKFNDAAATAKDKVDAYKTSLDSLIGTHVSAAQAETSYAQNSIDLAQKLLENRALVNGQTDVSKAKTLEQAEAINTNNRAIQDNVSAALDLASAQYRETGSLDTASAALATNRQNLLNTMIQTGYTEEAANKYLDRLGLTPDNINTSMNLDTSQPQGAMKWVDGQYQVIREGAEGKVTMDTKPAEKSLDGFGDKLADFVRRAGGGALSLVANLGGARASGGPVTRGSAYLVGERGPELFLPGRSGYIVPNAQMSRTSTSGTVNNITVNVTHSGLGIDSPALQRDVVGALQRWSARNGPIPVAAGS